MEKKDKFLKIAIYSGIALWIAGVLLSLLFGKKMLDNETYFEFLDFRIPNFILFIIMITIAPLLEEFVFRVWVFRRKITYIFSAIGILTFLYFISESWAITIACGLIFILFEFIIKENKTKKRIIFYFIFTSILFALSHLNNVTSYFAKMVYFIQAFGLGIIFGGIGLKYGFLYSLLGHVFYNLMVIIVLHFSSLNTDTQIWENDIYKAEIKSIGVINFENDSDTTKDNQTIITNQLPWIAVEFLGFNNDEYYKAEVKRPLLYQLKINIKDTSSFKKNQIIKDLINDSLLTTDTTRKECYVISVEDTAKLKYEPQDYYRGTLQNTLNYIQLKNNIPVKLKEEKYLKDFIKVKMEFIHQNTFKDGKEILENYGLNISDNPVGYKDCITFKYNPSDD